MLMMVIILRVHKPPAPVLIRDRVMHQLGILLITLVPSQHSLYHSELLIVRPQDSLLRRANPDRI